MSAFEEKDLRLFLGIRQSKNYGHLNAFWFYGRGCNRRQIETWLLMLWFYRTTCFDRQSFPLNSGQVILVISLNCAGFFVIRIFLHCGDRKHYRSSFEGFRILAIQFGPIHTGRGTRRPGKFEHFSFDVACLQCGHSHSHQQVPFTCITLCVTSHILCGLGLNAGSSVCFWEREREREKEREREREREILVSETRLRHSQFTTMRRRSLVIVYRTQVRVLQLDWTLLTWPGHQSQHSQKT